MERRENANLSDIDLGRGGQLLKVFQHFFLKRG